MGKRLRLLLAAIIAASAFGITAGQASAVAAPGSMDAVGDSITRAFDVTWTWTCWPLTDCPQYSWATGTSTSVNSQYLRLRRLNPNLVAYNDAKTGANMSALDGQLATAASRKVGYVTILMGANDVCTSGITSMTSTTTFRQEFLTAMTNFHNADPGALLYVSSLPNVYQLWKVLHLNTSAQSAWKNYNICQSMLSSTNTEAQRLQVLGQEQADNAELQGICGQFINCRWDGGAGYATQFPAADVSTIDYFHPNVAGQALVAGVTWKAGYWGP
jgi:lysophospholipase L1-like esterase